jgi:phosphoglycolate phosphatase-like HAD superfamily hydrolase
LEKKIIFDFDGVLVSSLPNLYAINLAAAAALKRSLSKDQYLAGFMGPLNRTLGAIMNLSEAELAEFVDHKRRIFSDHYNSANVPLLPFAIDLIKQAADCGELSILSTAPAEHLRAVLDQHQLAGFFAHIIGQSERPKSVFLEEAVRGGQTPFFITDTLGDLKETNKVSGVTSIAVTWGFHKEDVLKAGQPSLVAHGPKDVINYLRD